MIISFASSASFDLMSFSNSAKAVSLSFIFLMIGFVIFMLIIVFITHLPLRLLPSRTIIFSSCNLTSNLFTVESNTFIFSVSSLNDAIIGFFGFDFKSLSELIISLNFSHLNYRFAVYRRGTKRTSPLQTP